MWNTRRSTMNETNCSNILTFARMLVYIIHLKYNSTQMNTEEVSIPTWRLLPATKWKTSACVICCLSRHFCCKKCSSFRLNSNVCCLLRHSKSPPPHQILCQCCNLNIRHNAGWWPADRPKTLIAIPLGTTDQASTVLVRPNCYEGLGTKNGQKKLVLARHFSGGGGEGGKRQVYVSSYQLRDSLIRCHRPADVPNQRWISKKPSRTRLPKMDE